MQSISAMSQSTTICAFEKADSCPQDKGKQSPAQVEPQTHAVPAVKLTRHDPPLKIRPIDDPHKWITLLQGGKTKEIASPLNRTSLWLKEQLNISSKAELKLLLAKNNNDPALTAVVLKKLRISKTALRDKPQLRLIDKLSEELESEHGDEINAGLNTAEQLLKFSQDPDMLQQIRTVYYTTVVKNRSVNALFNAMTDLLGEAHFREGMSIMQKALTEDLMSAYPSTKLNAQLSMLMRDATIVNKLTNLFSICQHFLKNIGRLISPCKMTDVDFMRRVVNMTTSSFYLRELQRLNLDIVGENPKHQLIFLNYYYSLLKRLPDVLWTDLQQRNNSLLNVLRYMDQLTLATGDYQLQASEDNATEALKTRLLIQAGIPITVTHTETKTR